MPLQQPSHETLEKKVMQRIEEIGWRGLTPIQRKAIPVLLRRRNALLVAPTGSGKTEAAVLPIFVSLAESPPIGRGIRMLYITPLRALNRDILRRVVKYAEREGLRVEVRHGDTPQAQRRMIVQRPPEILITTPETLPVLITSRTFRPHLKALEWVVIDEFHELVGNERGVHLSLSLERLEEMLGEGGATRVGLSATIGDLDGAAKFLAGGGRKCAVIVDPLVREYRIGCTYVGGSLVALAEKALELSGELKGEGRSTLIFTNTRDEAEHLTAILKARAPEAPIEVHHGSLSREVREEAEEKLRGGEAGIVISTSSLELGIDIGAVTQVLQLNSPRQAIKLVQRIGRSRHQVHEAAVGTIITNRLDDELEGLALMKRVEQMDLEGSNVHERAYDVMAHHLAGLALERGSYGVKEALAIIKRAYPFKDIDEDEVKACLNLLRDQNIVRYDGELVRLRTPFTHRYYYENLSTIPDLVQFDVVDVAKGRTIGRLDQIFVGDHGEPGKAFVLKGSAWRIVSVDEGRWRVYVDALPKGIDTIPYWVGELIPVDFETARAVGMLRRGVVASKGLTVSEPQKERLSETIESLGTLPDDRKIVIEKERGRSLLIVHACLGSKVNQTLSMLLSTMIPSKTGYLVEARSDPYRILLSSFGPLDLKLVRDTLLELSKIEDILAAGLRGTSLMNWRIWHVAKRFGVIKRGAEYERKASRFIQEHFAGTLLMKEVLRELFVERFDIEATRRVLGLVREGRMEISSVQVDRLSPLAKPILDHASTHTALPLNIEKTVLDLVKDRLEKARHRLLCLSCGNWESVVRTESIREPFVCPLCRSRLVSRTYASDDMLVSIVKRKIRGRAVAEEEDKKFRDAWKVSSLIQNFGRKAIVALSAYGIGPDTAARVLRGSIDEESLYKNIYRAERTYVQTRGFWDD